VIDPLGQRGIGRPAGPSAAAVSVRRSPGEHSSAGFRATPKD
jgi:hypothetical protein